MACDLLLALLLLIAVLQIAVGLQPREVCLLQIEEGTCNDDIQRFYYNTISQQCEEFSYSGCGGNANNFRSFLECQKTCFRIPKIPQICRFPKKEGPCRGLFKRYFFNMTSMQCEPFTYGGCQGNENQFQNLEECMEYCKPPKTIPVICLDILDKGRCSASIPRYYYNSAKKTCEEFNYTGCGGGNNNFISKQTCMDVCAKNDNLDVVVYKREQTMEFLEKVNKSFQGVPETSKGFAIKTETDQIIGYEVILTVL